LGETDYHMALCLSRDIRGHLEELKEKRDEKVPIKCDFARDIEKYLSMKLEQMIVTLKELEASIDAHDPESILEHEPLIDALVDFLDQLIDAAERSHLSRPHGMRMQELMAWRESTSKLAQLLCQSIE
jgi:hypothetical protein